MAADHHENEPGKNQPDKLKNQPQDTSSPIDQATVEANKGNGTKNVAFIRGDWKVELTPEEMEKKRKRSEAAKKAAITRRKNKEKALAEQKAKEEAEQAEALAQLQQLTGETLVIQENPAEKAAEPKQDLKEQLQTEKKTAAPKKKKTAAASEKETPAEKEADSEQELKKQPEAEKKTAASRKKKAAAASEKETPAVKAADPEQKLKEPAKEKKKEKRVKDKSAKEKITAEKSSEEKTTEKEEASISRQLQESLPVLTEEEREAELREIKEQFLQMAAQKNVVTEEDLLQKKEEEAQQPESADAEKEPEEKVSFLRKLFGKRKKKSKESADTAESAEKPKKKKEKAAQAEEDTEAEKQPKEKKSFAQKLAEKKAAKSGKTEKNSIELPENSRDKAEKKKEKKEKKAEAEPQTDGFFFKIKLQHAFQKWGHQCRKRYRLLRLKLHPFQQRMASRFYAIGFHVEYAVVLAGRFSWEKLKNLGRFLYNILAYIGRPVKNLLVEIGEAVKAPFARLHSGLISMVNIYRDLQAAGRKHALWEAIKHVGRGVRDYHHLVSNLLMWGVAAAALIVFVSTVYTTLHRPYVMQVMVNEKSVGYVQSEEVFDNAYKNVQGQIVYTQQDDTQWNITPTYHLVSQENRIVSNEAEITESILRNSGEELIQATGLYIDDTFYGAVKSTAKLNRAMEDLKMPYRTQYPGAQIEFVENVELKEGLYLKKSLADEKELCTMLSSETQGTGTYTIQKGDTLSEISGKFGVSLSELYRLNPQLEDGDATYYPGDELVVSMAKHFLKVQAIVTAVEEEPIPYETEARTDPDRSWNYFKVLEEGEKGTKDVTYQRTFVDGNMVEEVKLDEVVTREPVTRVTVKGEKTPDRRPISMGSGMIFPVPAYRGISRGYSPGHPAMDIYAPYGTPIVAAQGGVVVKATYTERGYGWHVAIDHGGGLYTLYAHCSSLAVGVGQSVSQGDVIGYMGATGWATGNHLHFEVRLGGLGGYYRGCVDPAAYVGWGP